MKPRYFIREREVSRFTYELLSALGAALVVGTGCGVLYGLCKLIVIVGGL